ncbi:MAG: Na(+)/H(+) antiporter subunit A [Verrucomicrobiae bacterium]|nr:Na(+)/H(+) antiporter subunit A [Verrucomicrobiae bacterium]
MVGGQILSVMNLMWVIAVPLLAALATPLVGRVLGRAIGWWAVAASLVAAGLLVSLSGSVHSGNPPVWSVEWPAPDWGMRLALYADGWGWGFGLVVAGIGTLICIYAQHYLSDAEPRARFFMYLLLFESAMLGVVLSANLVGLVIFWELTSATSFLLIGFWHTQERARYGAYKALLITGLGGLALVAGVVLIYLAMGTTDIRELTARAGEVQAHPWFVPILVLVLLGVFTKSAQFPFHFWLPDAMTAPTPVSAFLHSATMVKAGVFLLGRIHPIFRGREEWFWIVSSVGMATMLLGAYGALRKTDLKALLAYSTISQLGLITLLYGFGTQLAALAATFHIFNHAAFKAGLFLTVGIVDHETGTRDKRVLKGLAKLMPITAVLCGVCALASAGVPLLNGFLSKELFYEEMVAHTGRGWWWWWWPAMAVGGSVLTFVYSLELFHGVFFGKLDPHLETDHGQSRGHGQPHDPGWGMLAPVAILAAICLKVGIWPGGIERYILDPAVAAVWGQPVDFTIKLWHGFTAPLILSILTAITGLVIYWQRHRLADVQTRLAWPFGANTIYDAALKGLVNGTGKLTDALQNGRLRSYLWLALAPVVVVLTLILGREGWSRIWPAQFSPLAPAEAVLLGLLIVATLAVVAVNQQRLTAVIVLGAVGALVSVFYLVLSAPDLALTQLLIEAITIILFLLVLWQLPKSVPALSTRGERFRDALLAVGFGVVMCLVVLAVAAANVPKPVADFYEAASLPRGGGRNIVNVILIDFRGFDTLGEITVLGIAALGALALMKLRRRKEDRR